MQVCNSQVLVVVLNGNKMARTKNFNQDEVLDKAVALFWEKGFNATSANDLVEKLGLSRSSLYDTYGDKRTLFIKSLERYRSQIVENMIVMINTSSDIKVTIQEIFNLIISQDINEKIPIGCFMVNSAIEMSAIDKEVAEIVKQNQKDVEQSFEKAISKGQKEGKISVFLNSKKMSKFYFNSITGIRVALKYNKNQNDINEIVKINLSILENR